ncbi:MAG: rRNA (cytidine1402-2-O)-methyltransferase, partial [Frankiaceae bacterium]|nr:rRNA (cytidine1402-2-O)-methyltransferase [Frankiaceae bacterium]
LTKTYEEVRRGPLAELADWSAAGVKGEVTLVVAGAPAGVAAVDPAELAAAVDVLVVGGMSRRDAVDTIAAQHGISRRVVYAAATRV